LGNGDIFRQFEIGANGRPGKEWAATFAIAIEKVMRANMIVSRVCKSALIQPQLSGD
jgi:hypothetical protein